ncbi:MAG: adenylate kinase [Elusimicrobia bacterium RIFOXYA2_FULL_39_19]|nr:MAG: adenylate kinase [Elusimicrobia bacterium RIFOXYA2_FULL_39_19]
MNIILLGAPGSGKGTQAKLIKELLKVPHISTGDIFREILKKDSKSSRKITQFINKGLLVPDNIVVELVKERLEKKDTKKGFISDGFPRNLAQAKIIDKIGIKIAKVVYFNLEPKESYKRLTARWMCAKCNENYNIITRPPKKDKKCDICETKLIQRLDDTPITVNKRLKIYKKDTYPLIKYYNKQKKMITINAKDTVKNIFEKVKNYLKK